MRQSIAEWIHSVYTSVEFWKELCRLESGRMIWHEICYNIRHGKDCDRYIFV